VIVKDILSGVTIRNGDDQQLQTSCEPVAYRWILSKNWIIQGLTGKPGDALTEKRQDSGCLWLL
jgi:hypothetical protein